MSIVWRTFLVLCLTVQGISGSAWLSPAACCEEPPGEDLTAGCCADEASAVAGCREDSEPGTASAPCPGESPVACGGTERGSAPAGPDVSVAQPGPEGAECPAGCDGGCHSCGCCSVPITPYPSSPSPYLGPGWGLASSAAEPPAPIASLSDEIPHVPRSFLS